ncbi:hypothetical protein ACFQU7_05205 [Pseudoroseomonas wenyumeiae]
MLKVTGIEPGHARSFEEVREQVADDLRREKAADLAYERANEVEDALAGGATLEEVGQRFGLPVEKVTIDARGQTQDGKPADLHLDASGRDVVLRAIFAAEPGQAPRLAEAGQVGLFAFDLQEVIPAVLKPFEQVEDQVRAAWVQDARRRSQEERAAALLGAVKGGKSLQDAARRLASPPAASAPSRVSRTSRARTACRRNCWRPSSPRRPMRRPWPKPPMASPSVRSWTLSASIPMPIRSASAGFARKSSRPCSATLRPSTLRRCVATPKLRSTQP